MGFLGDLLRSFVGVGVQPSVVWPSEEMLARIDADNAWTRDPAVPEGYGLLAIDTICEPGDLEWRRGEDWGCPGHDEWHELEGSDINDGYMFEDKCVEPGDTIVRLMKEHR